MRILYVNHTAEISGGERSLLDLLEALPGEVLTDAVCPRGDLYRALKEAGVSVWPITGTAGSLRLHPLHTPRALAEMALAAPQLRRIARRRQSEIVHANSVRAGIVSGLARASAATVVHVRDCMPGGVASDATRRLIGATATAVIANSRHTAGSLGSLVPAARVHVVHNGIDPRRWDPERIDRAHARAALGRAGERALLLGVVAQLTPWKGQDTAVQALGVVCREGVDAHLLLVGAAKFRSPAARYDSEDYVRRLERLVAAEGLQDRVSWLGERGDVASLVRALDVLLLPSWEEPFGRAVLEALALEVPVIATDMGGPAEIITDGREGLLRAPRDPGAWAQAIGLLAADPQRRERMGELGRRRVQEAFTLQQHVAAITALYEQLCDGASRRSAAAR
jgi:L-malate glycosyltransferase